MNEQELLARVNDVKQRIDERSKEFAILNSRITVRKYEIKAEGGSVKPNTATDPKLLSMWKRIRELNTELSDLHKQRKALNRQLADMPRKPRPKKPRGQRPKNRVFMGNEFRNCTGFERRLALLMAYEIGPERYSELKRQASDDTRNGETEFYTGGYKSYWDDACRTVEIRLADEFERRMTENLKLGQHDES